jgi:hypothetical protein
VVAAQSFRHESRAGTQEGKPVDSVHATVIAFATVFVVLICGFAAMGVATLFN